MMDWFDATDEELERARAVRTLFGQELGLFDYFFSKERPRLKFRPGVMHDALWQFDRKKSLLIKVGLDLWSRNGHVYFFEMLDEWDDEQWKDFIAALVVLLQIEPDDLAAHCKAAMFLPPDVLGYF